MFVPVCVVTYVYKNAMYVPNCIFEYIFLPWISYFFVLEKGVL